MQARSAGKLPMRKSSLGPYPSPSGKTAASARDLPVLGAALAGLLCGGCILDLAPPLVEQDGGLLPAITVETNSTDESDVETETGTPTEGPGPDVTETEAPTPTDPANTDDEVPDAMPTDEPSVTDPDTGCEANEEECDSGCVPAGACTPPSPPPCEETCVVPNATTECVDGLCMFVACDSDWVDCDGSLAEGLVTEPESDNGCETKFGSGISPLEPLVVLPLTNPTEDDWLGVDSYRLLATCSVDDCGQDHYGVPPQVALYENAVPEDDSDLRAGVSMGWEASGLWIRVALLDDEWIEGLIPSGSQDPDPRIYDHVEFVFDGINLESYGDAQDHHLFMGIDGNAWDERTPMLDERVSVAVETYGICRIMESKLSDGYISDSAPTSLLEPGAVFGFSIAVNDFDRNEDDPEDIQRQHRLFYSNPGPTYVFGPSRTLPQMTLSE